MASRLPADVYRDLIGAGFAPAAAVTMTAIAGGESSYDAATLGDVGLQTNTWGPSYGLYQIRTVKGETGTGSPRDIAWLAQSPANQARAAYAISKAGTDYTPWTVYTSGTWRGFLSTAQAAAGAVGNVVTTGTDGPMPVIGPEWAPWNWPSNLTNAAAAKVAEQVGGARNLAVEALVVGLGLVVVGVGVGRLVAPVARRGMSAFNGARQKIAGAVL